MKYLKVFTDFAEKMELLGDAERGRLFTAMLLYAETGTAPELKGNERFLWGTAKAEIDREIEVYNKKAEGAKKARSHINSDISLIESDIRTKNLISEQDKDKDKEKEKKKNIKENIKEKTTKHKYGDYGHVLLADDELAKLKERFPGDYERLINNLDKGIELKGYKYKNHYLAILKWAEKDAPAKKQEPKAAAPTSADMAHMADVLAKIKGGG